MFSIGRFHSIACACASVIVPAASDAAAFFTHAHIYRCFAPNPIGSHSSASNGRQRLIASSGLRKITPHLPPVTYCTISSAMPPTVNPNSSMKPTTHARSK